MNKMTYLRCTAISSLTQLFRVPTVAIPSQTRVSALLGLLEISKGYSKQGSGQCTTRDTSPSTFLTLRSLIIETEILVRITILRDNNFLSSSKPIQ